MINYYSRHLEFFRAKEQTRVPLEQRGCFSKNTKNTKRAAVEEIQPVYELVAGRYRVRKHLCPLQQGMCSRRTSQLAEPSAHSHEFASTHASVDSIIAGPRRCCSLREAQNIRRDLEHAAARAGTGMRGLRGRPGAWIVVPGRQPIVVAPSVKFAPSENLSVDTKVGSSWRTVATGRSGQEWKFLRKVVTSVSPKKAEPASLYRRATLSTEQKRQEPPTKSGTFFGVVRQAQRTQRKELPGARPQWPRVGEVIQQRTASEKLLLTKEEDEAFGQRMQKAARVTEFTDVVNNAIIEDYTLRHRLVRSSTQHT